MNKLLAGIYLLILSFATVISLYIPEHTTEAEEAIVIPKEAIRLRILANSDSEKDQELKKKIRDDVNKEITEWVSDLTSLPEARELLKSKLPEIQQIAIRRAEAEGITTPIKVDFGKATFPTKLYGQFLYPAGEYEAIVITIGEGEGANWWCVLYPPLCFLDFSNGLAVSPGVEEDSERVEEPIQAEIEESVDKETEEDTAEEEPVEMNQEEKEEEASVSVEEELVVHEAAAEKEKKAEQEEKRASSPEREKTERPLEEPLYAEGEPQAVELRLAIVEFFKRDK
ncbi:stage II sporulation protein R [Bacillus thermotolerans]|uniref:Stage II sporulation protein n=1 Tax=Bacillus thermotolerans TaxID=1221996 RepID=A0A0F5I6F5_BACTR|nr:stage II sporulation protein R [Bacillus thermotolerans]KKB41018.1 Stage II sporulation protein [Bacillus thermotolerans]